MPLHRHLLPWDRPLLPQAVAWLAAGWPGDQPLDLSKLLVVVPTRQAGRRLREALAAHAGQRGQAVFPPRVLPPEALTAPGTGAGAEATRIACQLAWIEVLRAVRLEEFRAVFPVDPPARDFAWARRLAEQLLKLQATLAEAALRIDGVPARAGADFPEAERWGQLAELERRYDAALARRKRRDPQAAKIDRVTGESARTLPSDHGQDARATGPAWHGHPAHVGGLPWPAGVEKIVVLATPDPLPLAVRVLEAYAATGLVEVVMFGPNENLFDAWGRPHADAWARRELDWPDFERRVHLCADPAEQAARLVALAQGYATPEGALAFGMGDPEVLALLEDGLARAGVAAFNPAGRPRRADALQALLVALADFAREASFAHAATLLRCPDVLAWLEARESGQTPAPARLLAELDALQARHLPATLAAARAHGATFPIAGAALAALTELRATLTGGEFPANAAAALTEVFAARQIASDSPLAESAGAWREQLRMTAEALALFPGATRAEGWELALEALAAELRVDDKPAGALELNGWLELLWEDAPHLVVAGLNDGCVPDAVVGDVFLPEALRVQLGLKTNAVRFARDAYLLAALAACRQGSAGFQPASGADGRLKACAAFGRLDVLVGRASATGDPLRPSRLLLRCADVALPGRVAFLFREIEAAQASLPWTRAWRLRPRLAPPPERISVTALRDWLACPFRFYLKHVLRMTRVDPAKTELDALDFGTLVHGALQAMGEDPVLRDCTDEAVLRTGLLAEFDRRVAVQLGGELTLPLVVQLEAARQRLGAAARVQAQERTAGWRIERVEWKFDCVLGGLTVRGKIDRIDRHVETGAVRVLDYKTSDTAAAPPAAHLGPVGPAEAERPIWTRAMVEDRARAWVDLQLPLYRRAVAAEFGPDVACGYFNLPKAAGETAVSLWDGLTPELQAAAEECAEQTAAAVAAGCFWPPTERVAHEDAEWAGLFHRGDAESVDWKETGGRIQESGGGSQATEGGRT